MEWFGLWDPKFLYVRKGDCPNINDRYKQVCKSPFLSTGYAFWQTPDPLKHPHLCFRTLSVPGFRHKCHLSRVISHFEDVKCRKLYWFLGFWLITLRLSGRQEWQLLFHCCVLMSLALHSALQHRASCTTWTLWMVKVNKLGHLKGLPLWISIFQLTDLLYLWGIIQFIWAFCTNGGVSFLLGGYLGVQQGQWLEPPMFLKSQHEGQQPSSFINEFSHLLVVNLIVRIMTKKGEKRN